MPKGTGQTGEGHHEMLGCHPVAQRHTAPELGGGTRKEGGATSQADGSIGGSPSLPGSRPPPVQACT